MYRSYSLLKVVYFRFTAIIICAKKLTFLLRFLC